MEKIHITPTTDFSEVVLREGPAPDLVSKKDIILKGTISAPADYYLGKLAAGKKYDLAKCSAIIDIEAFSIHLDLNDDYNDYDESILGKLSRSPELGNFKINTVEKYNSKHLAQVIKMNRAYFADRDEHLRLLKNLMTFKANVTQAIENSNDLKGNKAISLIQKVQTDYNLSFTLRMPIFKGMEPQTFKVEINCDIRDGGIDLWLESVELHELAYQLARSAMNEEIIRLEGITTIYI